MVRRSAPAGGHVISILTYKRPFFTDSKLFPLVQLVVRFDVIFQHYPLEAVFTVFSYSGVKREPVVIISRGFQMPPPAVF